MNSAKDKLSDRSSFNLDFLLKALDKGLLANSYIFAGENCDEEKYLVARELNKVLNCETLNRAGAERIQACGVCQNCAWIEAGTHPKTPLLIESLDYKSIKIAAIKDLQTTLSQSSSYFRIIIINPADYEYLNKHSANALLKSIEEPYPRTLYLLFSSSKNSILNTLKSRSHCLQFSAQQEADLNLMRPEDHHLENLSTEEGTKQQSLYQLYVDYKNQDNLNKDLKLRLFLESIKKDSKELILDFLEELQQQLSSMCLIHHESMKAMNTSSLLGILNFIEDTEKAKLSISHSVNPKLVIAHLDIFRDLQF